jgi:hypothetical protein
LQKIHRFIVAPFQMCGQMSLEFISARFDLKNTTTMSAEMVGTTALQ